MPLVGMISGGMDFTNKFLALSDKVTATNLVEAKKQGAVVVLRRTSSRWRINFVIVAFVMFLVVKAINKAKALAIEKRRPRRRSARTKC